MSTTAHALRSKTLRLTVALGCLAAITASGCGADDEASDVSADGKDPYRNVVGDKRMPKVTVTVREDDDQPVTDITYDASKGRIPWRGTMVYLQTSNANTWSTAYTLSQTVLTEEGDKIVEGVQKSGDVPA